jgi:hypothetical protein
MTSNLNFLTSFQNSSEPHVKIDSASLKDNGDLNISSFDFGPKVDKLWGHDYEYDITIDKEWKDTLLLLLIQEQFKTASEFKKWIDQKNIPATTSLW